MRGAEQLFRAVTRQIFDDVGVLAATVIALSGISLGILIREYRARRFEHSFADEIFRSDQFEAFVLTASFVVNGCGDLRIALVERDIHFRRSSILHIVFLISVSQSTPGSKWIR